MAGKKKGLGKGLEALMGGIGATPVARSNAGNNPRSNALGNNSQAQAGGSVTGGKPVLQAQRAQPAEAQTQTVAAGNRVLQVAVEQCQRGKYQPRRAIDSEGLEDLAASIKRQGVMQPIILREMPATPQKGSPKGDARYEIVAGERRWRAAQLAGLTEVPAIVREIDDEDASAMALIENLQREDLNPMDEAQALSRLAEEFNLTHQQIGDMVGRSRVAISNSLRLLSLHAKVRQMLENGDIEMGHARALLSLPVEEQAEAAREVVNRSLSVRQVEALARKQQKSGKSAKARARPAAADANIEKLQDELSEKLGVPVLVQHKSSGGGHLMLKYHSLDELDGILERIR